MTLPATRPVVSMLLLALACLAAAAQISAADEIKDAPPFHDYKGVHIGMTMDETRKLLGNPADKQDEQDSYLISNKESAQVYYDSSHKVFAISVTYLGSVAPQPKAVLGTDVESRRDGSLYKLIRFRRLATGSPIRGPSAIRR
jgi:hypothetical protein